MEYFARVAEENTRRSYLGHGQCKAAVEPEVLE
jgi:hypothetical protein